MMVVIEIKQDILEYLSVMTNRLLCPDLVLKRVMRMIIAMNSNGRREQLEDIFCFIRVPLVGAHDKQSRTT